MVLDRLNYFNNNISFYNGSVFEYDIKNAYPSLLKQANFDFVDKSLYEDINCEIDESNKRDILIKIGKEIKHNPIISDYLNSNLRHYLKMFQIDNNIDEKEIISIKKDALFVTTICNHLDYDILNFRIKNRYSLFFYDYISGFEYYISLEKGKYSYSIKGLGKEYDINVYNQICKIIYLTLINSDLSLARSIQSMFMNKDPKCIEFLPEKVYYKDFLYLNKSELDLTEDYKYIDFKSVYFTYYHNPIKTLINYLL